MADIWEELNSLPRNQHWERRRKYFLWKNKMNTTKTRYTDYTEEEFKKLLDVTETEWAWLERWEESEEYKKFIYIKYENNFDNDLLEVYDAIKKQAMEGNNSAVKTMLDLQEEINKRLKKNREDDKDLGLKLNI